MNADLAMRYLDGIATEAEVAELSALLRSSEEARVEYLRLARVHAELALDAGLWIRSEAWQQNEDNRINSHSVVTILLPKMWFALAAAACVIFAFVFWPRETSEAGTLVFAENCDWSLAEGQRVSTGSVQLTHGTALIRLDGGTELLLRGKVRLEIVSSGSADLEQGEVWVRAPQVAAGFTLHTPQGPVVDLGTEFHVSVDAAQTAVHVLEGTVQAAGKVFEAGKALRLEKQSTHEISFQPQRLAEMMVQAPKREKWLVSESFDYLAGDHDPGVLDGGVGWSGAWRLRSSADGENGYTGITRTMRVTDEKSLEAPAGKIFRLRSLAEPLAMNRDGVRYISLRFDEPSANTEQPFQTLSLSFHSSEQFIGPQITLRVNQNRRALIETGIGSGFASQSVIHAGKNRLLVAKVLTREDGEDEISLRVYAEGESPGLLEPAEWTVTSRSLRMDAALDLLMLQSSSQTPRHIDDLRIGETWRSVTTHSP
jgi:ferric-dicitrate binding protein FerR (iron transport regulator)